MGKERRLAKTKGVKVLSLFDGMSCGQIALDQLGIPVETYYASEIDKYAIQVTQANYPNTIQVGDVTKLNPKDFEDVDLIMGGSPCQGFSFAGKQLAFDDPRSALFFEFIRLLVAIKPKYFLLENVRMKKEFLDIISQEVSKCYPEIQFGISPILINSSLLSAQSRQRYYWTNIPNIQQPKDRGIVLRDILETNVNDKLSDKAIAYMNRGSKKYTGNKTRAEHYIKHESQKSKTITANMHKGVPFGVIAVDKPKQVGSIKDGGQGNRIYSQDGKSSTLSAQSGGTAGSGNTLVETKPKQLGMAADIKGHDILRRVYSPEGKSPCLNAGGGGNREPKVAQEGLTWRKLTPLECERLQTVPDNYTNHVSNTQRYKMLGNGWTVEVIKHILKNINDNK
jgi:DNA-cytosine methyltransferase